MKIATPGEGDTRSSDSHARLDPNTAVFFVSSRNTIEPSNAEISSSSVSSKRIPCNERLALEKLEWTVPFPLQNTTIRSVLLPIQTILILA